mmetsp:Transcript_7200/g.15589  ORF Transcript_7200/g.15589 Transcript_7200/m.15589 type:complete len:280 (-) Transcript_7200:36-875(-)
MLQPTERCCCGWTLPRAVQFIATYSLIYGFFSAIALITSSWPEDQQSSHASGHNHHHEKEDNLPPIAQPYATIQHVKLIVDSIGLIAGLKGYFGLVLRDHIEAAQKLRFQAIWLLFKAAFTIVYGIAEVVQACDLRARTDAIVRSEEHRQGQAETHSYDCSVWRYWYGFRETMELLLAAYCAYVTWSLAERMRNGEYGNRHNTLFGDIHYDVLEPQRTNYEGTHWLMVPQGASAQDYQANSRDRNTALQPFSGAPHTLGENAPEQCSMGRFQGTAHRLE